MKTEWASRRDEPNTIDLSDDDPEVVETYIHWLSFQYLPLSPPPVTWLLDDQAVVVPLIEAYYMKLLDTYIFGVKYLDNEYQKCLMHKLMTFMYSSSESISPKALQYLYQNTGPNDAMRKIVIRDVAQNVHDIPEWREEIEQYPSEVVVDLVLELSRNVVQYE